MNICIVGKYPPIAGGVASQTYWLTHGLAARGHHVHVVTNGADADPRYRIQLTKRDISRLERNYPGGGRVSVHCYSSETHTPRYTPYATPFVSALASITYDVIREHSCEALLGFYIEPYAVAAWMAGSWSGVPVLAKHAGSDLERLFASPDLYNTYSQVLRRCAGVVTSRALMKRFLGMGIAPERLHDSPVYGIPLQEFNRRSAALDINAEQICLNGQRSHCDPRLPTIGIYGKIGAVKGTWALLRALAALHAEGHECNFVAMVGEQQALELLNSMQAYAIPRRPIFLPLLPNWSVPAFLRACSAVCIVEHNFPIAIHRPITAREVLACGTCLLLSHEVHANMRFGSKLRDKENVLLVDPDNSEDFTGQLRSVLRDPIRASHIGQAGAALAEKVEDHSRFLDEWERLFQEVIHQNPKPDSPGSAKRRKTVSRTINLLPPRLAEALERYLPAVAAQQINSDHPLRNALSLCERVIQVTRDSRQEREQALCDAFQYLRSRCRALSHIAAATGPPFPARHQLPKGPIHWNAAPQIWPLKSRWVEVLQLAFDVRSLFDHSYDTEEAYCITNPSRRSTSVLFVGRPNASVFEYEIDASLLWLLNQIDGTKSIRELVLSANHARGHPSSLGRRTNLLRALEYLHGIHAVALLTHPLGGRIH